MPVIVMVAVVGPRLVAAADPEYRAEGSVVVLPFDATVPPPAGSEDLTPGNPYAEFSGSVSITAAILASIGSGDAVRQQVVDAGGTSDFSIEQDEEAPILNIEATANRQRVAIESVSVIASALATELTARQEQLGVPAESRIVINTIVLPERASELETARNRALTIVVALGVAGVIASTVIAESFARGVNRQRKEATARAAAVRAARMAEMSSTSRDLEVRPRPPQPEPPIQASNGEPMTPAVPQRR